MHFHNSKRRVLNMVMAGFLSALLITPSTSVYAIKNAENSIHTLDVKVTKYNGEEPVENIPFSVLKVAEGKWISGVGYGFEYTALPNYADTLLDPSYLEIDGSEVVSVEDTFSEENWDAAKEAKTDAAGNVQFTLDGPGLYLLWQPAQLSDYYVTEFYLVPVPLYSTTLEEWNYNVQANLRAIGRIKTTGIKTTGTAEVGNGKVSRVIPIPSETEINQEDDDDVPGVDPSIIASQKRQQETAKKQHTLLLVTIIGAVISAIGLGMFIFWKYIDNTKREKASRMALPDPRKMNQDEEQKKGITYYFKKIKTGCRKRPTPKALPKVSYKINGSLNDVRNVGEDVGDRAEMEEE